MNKHRFQFGIIFALLTVFLLVVSSVAAAPKDGPVVQLSSSQSEYTASQEVLVTVTISNPTRHSVRILKWFTPGDGVEEPIFVVRLNGEPVAYSGAIYKRPAPTGSDYLTLKSGESAAYTVNLGDYYPLTGTGQYEIFYSAAAFNLFSEKGSSFKYPDSLQSKSLA